MTRALLAAPMTLLLLAACDVNGSTGQETAVSEACLDAITDASIGFWEGGGASRNPQTGENSARTTRYAVERSNDGALVRRDLLNPDDVRTIARDGAFISYIKGDPSNLATSGLKTSKIVACLGPDSDGSLSWAELRQEGKGDSVYQVLEAIEMKQNSQWRVQYLGSSRSADTQNIIGSFAYQRIDKKQAYNGLQSPQASAAPALPANAATPANFDVDQPIISENSETLMTPDEQLDQTEPSE